MNQDKDEKEWETWWVLQMIKRKLLENYGNRNIEFTVHVFANEPAIPTFTRQEEIFHELQSQGVITVRKKPQTGMVVSIGMDDYAITVHPLFDEFYKQFENRLSTGKSVNYFSSIESYSNEIKRKIIQVIDVLLQKSELKLATASYSISEDGLHIPFDDFLNENVSRNDLEKLLLILGKLANFTPYFTYSKTDVILAFHPSSPIKTVFEFLKKLKEKIDLDDKTPLKSKRLVPTIDLSFPEKVQWEKVMLKMKEGMRDIEIFYNSNFLQTADYIQLGFFTGKKQQKPDRQWGFLCALSVLSATDITLATADKMRGMIAANTNITLSIANVHQIKRTLVERLMAIFKTDDDPFYDKRDYYHPKFTLLPEPVLRQEKIWSPRLYENRSHEPKFIPDKDSETSYEDEDSEETL